MKRKKNKKTFIKRRSIKLRRYIGILLNNNGEIMYDRLRLCESMG